MNPHAPQSVQPLAMVASIYKNRNLIFNLIKREVMGRYRGSAMGLLWSFFNPVFMLTIYTFVFSVVFKARWVGGSDSKVEFALVLFTGLLVFNLFSEVINQAPSLILNNTNYVKKIIFPLEILPIVALGAAAFHMSVSLVVWLIFYFLFFSIPDWTALQLPLVLIPLMLMTLGLAWLLASLGVYLRDVGQIIGVVTMTLMFLSPIFYSVDSLPLEYQGIMHLNPLTYIVEETRNVMIWHKSVNWPLWVFWTVLSTLIAWLGFAWFQKTRKGFADVI
ncbi:ABC transporter permease [Pseudomonas sp. MF6776]|uniref:ABC transporter permease n=1 Tax=Pseudomonas sp. MF6776 TaxID=2797534 RepID=UPI00190B7684|nr:ABC transporter permease [Pseudomonas sp. MF6776]MBK3468919.1 ABC transporter permease [Pseudomonas sp. MF6776]